MKTERRVAFDEAIRITNECLQSHDHGPVKDNNGDIERTNPAMCIYFALEAARDGELPAGESEAHGFQFLIDWLNHLQGKLSIQNEFDGRWNEEIAGLENWIQRLGQGQILASSEFNRGLDRVLWLFIQKLARDAIDNPSVAVRNLRTIEAQAELEAQQSLTRRSDVKEIVDIAQATLTALNVGNVQSGSKLHLKLREVMIANRDAAQGAAASPPVTTELTVESADEGLQRKYPDASLDLSRSKVTGLWTVSIIQPSPLQFSDMRLSSALAKALED